MSATRPITKSLFIRELETGPEVAQIFTTLACGEEGNDCGIPWYGKKATTEAVGEECGA